MFKENYIKKLAFDNIRHQKQLYRYVFIALVLSFFISSFMFITVSSNDEISYTQRALTFGKWSVAVENNKREQVMVNDSFEQGKVYFLGDVSDHQRLIGQLGAMDENAYELTHLQLSEGRYPTSGDEVVIEEGQCQYLGISDKINQYVTIQHNNITKEMKLVGILKNYSNIYPIEMPTFWTKGISDNYILFVNSNSPLDVFNYFAKTDQEQNIIVNHYTYPNYSWDASEGEYTDSSIIKYMEVVIVGIGCLSILSTTLSSMNKRKEHLVLMRSLGMTLQQIQQIILYEGLFLLGIGGVIGTISGLLLGVIFIVIYHLISVVPLIIILNIDFFLSLFVTIILGYGSLVLGSLSVFNIPLNHQFKQSVKKMKYRRIRKLNLFSLAIQEVVAYKKIFYLLSLLICVIVFSFISLTSEYNYLKQHKNQSLSFSYEITGDSLSNENFRQLNNIKNLNPIVTRYESAAIHVNGLENWDNAEQYSVKETKLPYQWWLSDSSIMTSENNDSFLNILIQQNFEGRMPENKNETLAIIPYTVLKSNIHSFQPIEDQELEQHQIEIGDIVDVADIYSEKVYTQQLEVVGTIRYKTIDSRMNELTSHGGYQFVVTPSTFQDLFGETGSKTVYIETTDNEVIHQLKSVVYSIMRDKPDVFINDNISTTLVLNTQIEQNFVKNISLISLMIISVSLIIYMQRKIKALSMKHEIGLMKALGLTQGQFISIYMIYDVMVFLMALVWLFLLVIIINLNQINSWLEIIVSLFKSISLWLAGVWSLVIMILPFLKLSNKAVIGLLTENSEI